MLVCSVNRGGRLPISEPRALVERFFRQVLGRFCTVVIRSFGVRRLELVKDIAQAALVQALETRCRRGVPEDPAGCKSLFQWRALAMARVSLWR
jgi:predicted RNA polymerase sigma factor